MKSGGFISLGPFKEKRLILEIESATMNMDTNMYTLELLNFINMGYKYLLINDYTERNGSNWA